MKIIYLANARIPTEMAHGLQIMKTCEALAKQGADIELIIPHRLTTSQLKGKDSFRYYNIQSNFRIKKLPSVDLIPPGKFLIPLAFWIQTLTFALFAVVYLLFRKADFIYSRDRFVLSLLFPFRKNLIYEAHKFPEKFSSLNKFLFRRFKKIIVITSNLKDYFVKNDISQDKILKASDAVDFEKFDIPEDKKKYRQKLGLSPDKKLVLYTGQLYKWKGVHVLARASKFLPQDVEIVLVGGFSFFLKNFQKFLKQEKLKNIRVLGHKEYSDIPNYLKAADCLVLTGTKQDPKSRYFTSPMKMFEYMVSKRPIVASDLPSFKEVLDDNNSILVKPDDPQALARGIKKALENVDGGKKISEQAYKDAQKYTWDKRAELIINYLKETRPVKIIYLTANIYPSQAGSSYQTLRMAKAFSRFLKNDFLLIIAKNYNFNELKAIPYIETKYTQSRLRTIYYSFWLLIFFIKTIKSDSFNIVYSKDSYLTIFAIILRNIFNYRVCFEYHQRYNDWRDRFIIRHSDYLLPLTKGAKRKIIQSFNISEDKILVAFDAVDLEAIKKIDRYSQRDLRKKLNLPLDKKLIGYVSRLRTQGMDKGLYDLILALKELKSQDIKDIILYCVGGPKEFFNEYKKFAKDNDVEDVIIFVDYIDHDLALQYIKSFDILAMPFPRQEHYIWYMSPLKLFDYMGCRKPIIASNLPSLREILNEKNSILVEPENPKDIARGIKRGLDNRKLAEKISFQAYQDVQKHTWKRRAKRILNFINEK